MNSAAQKQSERSASTIIFACGEEDSTNPCLVESLAIHSVAIPTEFEEEGFQGLLQSQSTAQTSLQHYKEKTQLSVTS